MLTLPSVPAEEAAPFYQDFLAACPDGRVGLHLQAQIVDIEELCAGLTESAAMFRYAEGQWTIKEVIGHLLNTERVFAYRLLRISRGDVTELPGCDETISRRKAGSIYAASRNWYPSSSFSDRVRWHS